MSATAPDIWTVPSFASATECESLIARAEAIGFEAATINTQRGAERDDTIRNNDRVIIDDHDLANDLWQRLKPHIPPFVAGHQAIGLNERFRFYRYDPSQRFRGHVDNAYTRATGEASLLTFMIYLNDAYEGGETTFPDQIVVPERGLALLFHHEIFHEGRPVLSGRKYVLRSDVMFNPVGKISG
jgi:predicted 2-oxoglutarate/Fe(II)-dependent dioxygenase YbiX